MQGDAGVRCPPDLVETHVEQKPPAVIQDSLPRDRAPAALHGFVNPEHAERSDSIGWKKEAGADMLLFARALDDRGGEPPLPQGPREREPGYSAADDQDPWRSLHRFGATLGATNRRRDRPPPAPSTAGAATARKRLASSANRELRSSSSLPKRV
jgi:hypothetical protein